MSYSATRRKRFTAGVLAGAMAFTVMPILGFTGTASAAHLATADPIGAGNVCEGAPDQDPFVDVTEADPANEEIECMVNTNPQITQGTSATTYEPNAFVQRRQMALFLQRVADVAENEETSEDAIQALPADDGVSAFTDIQDETADHQQAIRRLEDSGITTGVTATEFRPGENVTRRQMAKFLVRLQNYLAGENFDFPTVNDCVDCFNDDDGDTGEDELNVLAREGVFIGTGGEADTHNVSPGDDITRRQMAFVLTRKLQVLFDAGLITQLFETAPPTNQTFTVTPAEAATFESGDAVEFTVTDITSDTVDIALFECGDVTIDENGIVTLNDVNSDGHADVTATDATITEVNNVSGAFGDHVNDATVTDGGITFTVQSDSTTEECVIAVVFNDADDDNALDVDADGAPTEEFAVGGEMTFATITALDATPEYEINRFGEDHTVTASLVDADGNTVAVDGDTVRFTLYLVDSDDDNADTIVTDADGNVVGDCSGIAEAQDIEQVTVTDGTATYTFTQADPNATADSNDFEYCVEAEVLNRTLTGDEIDYVGKVFSDDAAAATALTLTPETETNATGTQHTVTATVTDQFGDPADTTVRFEVYRDGATTTTLATTAATGADGEASFTYTGPATQANDVIVACVEDAADADTVCSTDGGATFDDPGDTAEKAWVVDVAGAPEFTAASAAAGDTVVLVNYDEAIDCDTVDLNASNYEVTTTAADATVTDRVEVEAVCFTPIGGADDQVEITIAGSPLIEGETVTVTAVTGDDGNTVLDFTGTAQPVGDDVATTVTAAAL